MGVSPAVTWHQVASDEQSLALIPLPGWQPNTCYTLEVRSAQGSPNPTFFTRRLASFSGATQGRDPETPISLAFLYPVDACSVEQALHLEPETPYRLSWSGQTLYLKPETSWDVETTYTLTLGAEARDSAGMPLGKPLSWNFTIRSLVAGFSPQTKVFPCTAIAITFNRPADRKSVEAAFHITPTFAGTFEWQENALRFVPQEGLSAEAYQVLLEPSARASDGRPLLRRPLRWNLVNFGYGSNLQIVDAAGPRRIQYSR